MIDYGKLYDEFLYDCYIANQRLTAEDWFYYGKETHHVEIPSRDGGLLTSLNSQPLTLYQHWIAGVLQSEVLDKVCFACIPKGVLPHWVEQLRLQRLGQDTGTRNANRAPEQRSESAKKRWAAFTTERRLEILHNAHTSLTKEKRSELAHNHNAKFTPEERSEIARKGNANRSPEKRTEAARKGWETRRRKQQGG
jgi:hypothetical protein